MFLAWMTGKKLEFGKFILRERFFYSALDVESERIVQNALDKLIKGNQYIFFTLPQPDNRAGPIVVTRHLVTFGSN